LNSYECTRCHQLTDTPVEVPYREHYAMGNALVSHDLVELHCQCGGEVCEVSACVTCKARRCAGGADACLECLADAVEADPTELAGFSRSLLDEVGRVLAPRMEKWLPATRLTVPQAGDHTHVVREG
jgi:hypothetical protein